MAETFMFGINAEVPNSAFLQIKEVFALTGHNTGNLAFHHAVVNILGGHQTTEPWHQAPEVINHLNKTGVMPCANQLGSHSDYGTLAERFARLTIPLVAIGLGAQGDTNYEQVPAIPDGTVRWVKEIIKRGVDGAPNIGVRGPFTLRVLENYGISEHAIVLGCPSLFLNPDPHLGRKIESRGRAPFSRIAVAAGHQRWTHLASIEHALVREMERGGGAYIVQSPQEMVAIARSDKNALSQGDLAMCRDYVKPELSLEEFWKWARPHFRVYFSVPSWIESLLGFDFVVGARIHGVMLGLQAGIPGLCIAHDSRTREMCEVMQVPFIMAADIISGADGDELRRRFVFDGEAFDQNRRLLAQRLNTFLISNNIGESKWLKRIYSV